MEQLGDQNRGDGGQRAVIAFLGDTRTYGASVTNVEQIQTHAAIVFLVGDHAYKMKRAVAYAYLDFTTLESRERAIRAELALNRPAAPALYLSVVPVTRAPDGALSIGGAGVAIEWLLVMRRFRQEDLFDRMAIAGRLTPSIMGSLADGIARFHEGARKITSSAQAGGMAEVLDIDRGGFLGSRQAFPAEIARALHYQDMADAALSRLAPLLDRRREEGHVRQCHGDLHLGNICLFEGAPTLFDCIEFDDALAQIDVLYDLGFLLMDLEHRDLRALGNAVFNRYLDRREEEDGIAALPFFLSTRAAVRAHVGFTAASAQRAQGKAEERVAAARSYLALAEALLVGAPPRLVAIGGLSGSGKSTLAMGLAPELGACPGARVLRSDVERKRLMGVAPEERLPPSAYSDEIGRRVYDILFQKAEAAIRAGHSIVLDAVLAREGERARAAALASRLGVPFTGIWLEAPAQTMGERIAARARDASDATQAILDRQLTYDLGRIDWARIQAGRAPGSVLADARAALAG